MPPHVFMCWCGGGGEIISVDACGCKEAKSTTAEQSGPGKRDPQKKKKGGVARRDKEWKIAVRGICVSGSSRRGKFKECTTLRGAFECTSVECFRRGWRRRCFRLLRPGVGPLTPRESDTGGAHHVNQGRYSHARVPGNRARSW